jgi:hypothetical protein
MKKILSGVAMYALVAVNTVSAQFPTIGDIEGGSGAASLNVLIIDLLNFAIGAAAIICVVVLIASGYMYITAAGDEGKIEKATKSLTFAIIGLVICLISILLVTFVVKDLLQGTV